MGKDGAFITFRIAGFQHHPAASELKVPCCNAPHAAWFPLALEWKGLVPNTGLTPGTRQPGSAAPQPCCSSLEAPKSPRQPRGQEPSVLALEN